MPIIRARKRLIWLAGLVVAGPCLFFPTAFCATLAE
jgi:hypothetical protein